MRTIFLCFLFVCMAAGLVAQEDSAQQATDSFRELYLQSEKMRIADSIRRVQLTEQYNQLKESEHREKLQLQAELERMAQEDSMRRQEMLQRISQLKRNVKGYAVTINDDTLFYIYNRIGATMPAERADDITRRIKKIVEADFFSPDSIMAIEGDRIKIGEMTGDVIEKTLLVTRLRTVKNEEITIPNASVLSGNTINYSAIAHTEGLVVHTTVTIGYDVPWRDMHQALIDAALQVDLILKEPAPFVLQTALNDFYVSYQINSYTHYAGRQALIYSELHKNIQDLCNERGIEILSPHYRAQRDGNSTTIPSDYLGPDYKAPTFNVAVTPPEKSRRVKPKSDQNS